MTVFHACYQVHFVNHFYWTGALGGLAYLKFGCKPITSQQNGERHNLIFENWRPGSSDCCAGFGRARRLGQGLPPINEIWTPARRKKLPDNCLAGLRVRFFSRYVAIISPSRLRARNMAKNRASATQKACEEAQRKKRLTQADLTPSKRPQQVKGIAIDPPVAVRVQPVGDTRPAMDQIEAEVERDLRRLGLA